MIHFPSWPGCVHTCLRGLTGALEQRKEKKGKGWRGIIYPVPQGIFFTGLGHFDLNSFRDERSIEGLRVA